MKLIEIIDLDGTNLQAKFRSPSFRHTGMADIDVTPLDNETHGQIIRRIKQELEAEWQAWEATEIAKLRHSEVVGAFWDGTAWVAPRENKVIGENR